MFKLDIYLVVEGSSNWPLYDVLKGDSEQEVLDEADSVYGSDLYHWTNPYEGGL